MKRFARLSARFVIWGVVAVTAASAFQKQPRPKSQKEVEALQALFKTAPGDDQIAAAENLLSKFSDTDFKSIALYMEADSYGRKNQFEKCVVFGERALDADPGNYQAMLLLARQYAAHTTENDLDKEEKLNKAAKYANDALGAIDKAVKPNPQVTDDQWNAAKKDYNSQAHEALGMIADVRKKYDVAVSEYKSSMDNQSTVDPATMVRYAVALEHQGKFDDAIATLDKVIADPNSQPVVKQYATNEKNKATTLKNAAKK
jgi:tetratricopeptide (TPR) repeat protein